METKSLKGWSIALSASIVVWACVVGLVCTRCELEASPVASVEVVEVVTEQVATIAMTVEQVVDPLQGANVIENCTVTYYCTEAYDHICGNGDGLTALGTPVVAGQTVAVDTGIIPYGSTVWVDYGDGVGQAYIAEDCGSAIKGGRIDIAVETHAEAVALGVALATVYWRAD